jgi:hypothetical protein
MRAVPVPSPSEATGVDMLTSCAVTGTQSISAHKAEVTMTLRRTDSTTVDDEWYRQWMSFATDLENLRGKNREEKEEGRGKRVRPFQALGCTYTLLALVITSCIFFGAAH